MKILLKIATILSFMLPSVFFFIGCDGVGDTLHLYHNEEIAMQEFPESVKEDSEQTKSDKTIQNKVLSQIISPSKNSLSGIGIIIFYKDNSSRIIILISFLISIILFFEKFIKKYTFKLYLISTSCILYFIISSGLITHATLKWGIFIMLILNILGCIIYYKEGTNTIKRNNFG